MRICIALFLPFLVSSCATGPYAQNPHEFINYFETSNNLFVNSLKKKESFSVSRSQTAVAADITKLASSCINGVVVSHTIQQGNYRESGKVRHTAKVSATTDMRKLFSLQMEDTSANRNGVPDGGTYVMVADIRPAGQNITDLTIYYIPGAVYSNIAEKIKSWAAGDKKECPKLT